VHYKLNSYSLALPQFSQAVEGLPENNTIRYHLALALDALGKKAEARKELAITLNNSNPFPERPEAEALLAKLQREE